MPDGEHRPFGTWTVEEVDDPVRDEYDYVVESGSGNGLIYCMERQLRELRDEIDDVLDGGEDGA